MINYYSNGYHTRLIIDKNLNFNSHTNFIIRKAYLSLKQLFPFKNLLNESTKKTLINSIVTSHFTYADVVYGPCLTKENKNRLQRMQNHCIRFINSSISRRDHVTPYYRTLGILKLNEARFVHYSCMLNKILATKLPEYLFNKISKRSAAHDKHLRYVDFHATVPQHRSKLFESSFSYLAPYIVNRLPKETQEMGTSLLRRKLKLLFNEEHLFPLELDKF
jgi:hypothetical protein